MKILFIHQAYQSADGPGGTRHFEFAKHVVAQGHEMTVIASDVSYMSGEKFEKSRRSEVTDGVRIIRASTPMFIHRSLFWRTISFVWYMLSSFWAGIREPNVDLVMGTSPSLFQAFAASWVAFFRRKPFLLEVRDLWPDFAIDMGVLKSKTLIWMARRVESFIYWRAKHILVNSPAYADYLQDRGIPLSSISLIPNGVDPGMFDRDTSGDRIRAEFGLEGKFVATYSGAIGPANDIATIIRAAKLLESESQIHILLIGGGKDVSTVTDMITEIGLTNCTFGGTKPKSEMDEVLSASDVCLATLLNIPMFRTVYPNKIFDYMAAAKPIVLGIDGVIRDVVDKSGCGMFIEPGNEKELAEAVKWMHNNQAESRQMGLKGRSYVTEHFNRDSHSKEFLVLASSLV